MISSSIAEQLAPIVKRLDANDAQFSDHLLYVANQSALYPTRAELREDMTEIKAMIQRLEDRR